MSVVVDKEIIERLKRDDLNALGELYNLLSKKIYNRCLFILKDKVLAEDATQDLFLKAFQQIGSLKEEGKIEPWLNRMAYNYCMDYFRKKKKFKEQLTPETEGTEEFDLLERIEEIEQSAETKEKLKAEINNLNETERMVLILYYWEGMSIQEISTFMDLGISAVKMKLSRTRSKLRDNLGQEGFTSIMEVSVLILLNLV
jgi:RNA polymerase sigma factor (sigma-70 family)